MQVRFGPAGNPASFQLQGHKSSLDMPFWLKKLGLDAYEYQCVRGVHIGEEMARRLGERAAENGVALSIHAPYYITLGTADPDLREKTKKHFFDSLRAAHWMGARTVVFHPGGGAKDRDGAKSRAMDLLAEIVREAAEKGWSGIRIAPETAGKPAQLGNLEEVLEFCAAGPEVVPAVDFGHLHAASQGGFDRPEAFEAVLDRLENVLGRKKLANLHIHFSPVEFTAGGEKRHWTTLEEFGPGFGPLAELLAKRKISATVICESAGRQAEDALIYKQMYEDCKKGIN
jgi:deoxyribonuclease-4